MGAFFAFGNHRRADRFNRDNLAIWVLLFEVTSRARYGAARPNARNKGVDLAIAIIPDFRACCFIVNSGVSWIDKLPCLNSAWRICANLISFGLRRRYAARGLCQDKFSAQEFHHFTAFNRHLLGHHKDCLIALGRRGEGDANTCIT